MSVINASHTDMVIELPHLKLVARAWGPNHGYPILALHGWLDNSASFEPLVADESWLHDHNWRLIALDLAGHGHSQHRPKGCHPVFLDYVDDLHQVIQTLKLEKPWLLGHSMGGGIATVYAGTGVTELAGVILIEALGPLSSLADDAPKQLAKHLSARHRHTTQQKRAYQDIAAVIKLRAEQSGLPEDIVKLIIQRNMMKTEQGYQWRSDPRLRVPSAVYMTHEQIEAFVAKIACPTMIISAEDGLMPNYPVLGERAELLKLKTMVAMSGGHHLHMTNPEPVRNKIIEYITKTTV